MSEARRRPGSTRAALVGAGLVATMIIGFTLGRSVQPPPAAPSSAAASSMASTPGTTAGHVHATAPGGVGELGGLSMSANGYTLAVDTTAFAAGVAAPFAFHVVGPDRRPVTEYLTQFDKPLHLVLVRHDLTGYQHLHPTLGADGTWSIQLTLPAAGVWRAYTDFAVRDATGQPLAMTLAEDLTVAGDYRPTPLPAPVREWTADGYTVTYEGTPQLGATQPLSMRVFVGGAPVPDLERYLGAFGHLVVLRDGDLGYLHVHPENELIGGAVKFWLAAPSPGRYRAFFDYQVGGVVRTAQFTFEVR